ncbi:hypothetical protein BDB00DRAFT_819808 [Zychaea mexicana]|uniref:uncharacterized protein n=1 Tax=Zychaea mexicana TaxID=64656 RepID=UPI0022FECE4E|nr:uncharacterized protein BDB00DRAFT_819808 [Zychaea mexicana]KAI9494144.1 hypothetical protein BDB00DRAFT_819808 [Zychaea mexicana]
MSSQLEELTFDAHNYNMAFLQVMKACPRLTHFSYSVYDYVPPEVYDTEPVVVELSSSTSSLATVKTTTTTEAAVEKMEEDENPLDYSSKDDDDESLNITYLCLNAVLHKDKRAAPILRRCPKLRYLAISNIDIDSDFHMWPSKDSIDLDMFFRLCPLLQCIECNSWDGNQQQQQQRWRQYARDIHYSPRNHQHLLLDNGSSNSPSRRSKDKGSINDFTEEGGLRELITSGAEGYGADQIIPILKRNKSTLQILDLGEGISARGDSWDASSDWSQLEHITHLQRLHTFSYKYLSLNDRVLCGFLRQCPVLTDLTLWCKMTIIPDELLLVINNKLPLLTRLDLGFTSTLAVPSETTWRWFFTNNNGRLKRLCLRWNNFISDAVLDAIGTMRQLEELHLRHTAKRATRMDALRRLNHLDRLELWTVDAPLDPVLSDLYWLKELYLVGCKEVSSHGLRALVDTPGCKLKKLRVQSCGSIRPHMMDYIDSKLASLSSSPSHQ